MLSVIDVDRMTFFGNDMCLQKTGFQCAAYSFHLFHAIEGIAALLQASFSFWHENIERYTNNFS